jgi:Rieske Fe-S protein
MDKKQKINRKTFFKWAALALTIPFYKIWVSSVNQKQVFARSEQSLTIDADMAVGVYFFDRVILNKTANDLHLFSSRCTHLGCKISKIENSKLVCPCHGSQFSLDGSPIKGPAVRPLETIDYRMEEEGERVRIYYRI